MPPQAIKLAPIIDHSCPGARARVQSFSLASTLDAIEAHFAAATPLGLITGPLVFLLALLIGYRLNHYFSQRTTDSLHATLLNAVGPLISPLLATLFSLIGLAALRAAEAEGAILLLSLKIAIAWGVIQLLLILSSRRTASWFAAVVIIPMALLQLFGLLDATVETLSDLTFSIGSVKFSALSILKGLMALFLLQWLAGLGIGLLDQRLARLNNLRPSNRALIMKISQIVIYCVVFLFSMQVLGISITALGVFGGALGVGIGFGLQKIASNFISGIILLFEKSIEIGDMIELPDGTTGHIRQTYARYTRLEMANGKEIFIPNEEFITQRVISWTHTNTRAQIEIPIIVAYDTDMDLARRLMVEATDASKDRLENHSASCTLNNFTDRGVELKLSFWIRDIRDGRSDVKSNVMAAVLEAFRAHNIRIPSPQREMYLMSPGGLTGDPA